MRLQTEYSTPQIVWGAGFGVPVVAMPEAVLRMACLLTGRLKDGSIEWGWMEGLGRGFPTSIRIQTNYIYTQLNRFLPVQKHMCTRTMPAMCLDTHICTVQTLIVEHGAVYGGAKTDIGVPPNSGVQISTEANRKDAGPYRISFGQMSSSLRLYPSLPCSHCRIEYTLYKVILRARKNLKPIACLRLAGWPLKGVLHASINVYRSSQQTKGNLITPNQTGKKKKKEDKKGRANEFGAG